MNDHEDNHRPVLLSSSAVKDLEHLPQAEQKKIVRILEEPLRPERCESIQALARWGVKRARIGDLRIAFRSINDRIYILRVGQRGDFYRITRQFDPNAPVEGTPLEEWTVKKNSNGRSIVVPEHAKPQTPPPAATAPTGLVTSEAAAQMQQLLGLLCQTALTRAVDPKLDRFLADLVQQSERIDDHEKQLARAAWERGDLADRHQHLAERVDALPPRTEKLEESLAEMKRGFETRINKQSTVLNGQQKTIDELRGDLQTGLEGLTSALAAERTAMDGIADRLRADLQAAATMSARADRMEQMLTEMPGLLNQRVMEETDDLHRQLSPIVEELASLRRDLEGDRRAVEDVRSLLTRLEEKLAAPVGQPKQGLWARLRRVVGM